MKLLLVFSIPMYPVKFKNLTLFKFYRKRIDAALEEFNITFYLFDDVLKKVKDVMAPFSYITYLNCFKLSV